MAPKPQVVKERPSNGHFSSTLQPDGCVLRWQPRGSFSEYLLCVSDSGEPGAGLAWWRGASGRASLLMI